MTSNFTLSHLCSHKGASETGVAAFNVRTHTMLLEAIISIHSCSTRLGALLLREKRNTSYTIEIFF
jgi:hypothetical protein